MSSLDTAQAQYRDFAGQFRSISLATANAEGVPHASYAPFVRDDDAQFYIYVSQLSTHTQNLQENPRASLIALEDEAQTEQIFARCRVTFECHVTAVDRESPEFAPLLDRFGDRFGELMDVLRNLTDFQLFRLTPHAGRFVMGFGAAYDIDLESDRLKLVRGGGHGSSKSS